MEQTPEQMISQELLEILDKLELIPDMEAYEAAYRILQEYPLSGRRVAELWKTYAVDHPMFFREKRFMQLKSYRDYPYMEKRWQKHQKKKNLQELSWTQVHDCCIGFLEPIWDSVYNQEVFLADWMPELGRFLG